MKYDGSSDLFNWISPRPCALLRDDNPAALLLTSLEFKHGCFLKIRSVIASNLFLLPNQSLYSATIWMGILYPGFRFTAPGAIFIPPFQGVQINYANDCHLV